MSKHVDEEVDNNVVFKEGLVHLNAAIAFSRRLVSALQCCNATHLSSLA